MTATSLLSAAKGWAVRAPNSLLRLLGIEAVPRKQLDELRRVRQVRPAGPHGLEPAEGESWYRPDLLPR